MSRQRRQQLTPTRSAATALRRLQRWMPQGVRAVIDKLHGLGAQAYVVGGVVRDAFLGRPGNDWDVATDAPPGWVAETFSRVVRAGEKHGTIMVLTETGPVEVTTFRSEGPYLDGRRPAHVAFHPDIEKDLARRDFTINAMAADIAAARLVDPFGGQDDLRARRVRAVGEPQERFAEDGLRPLRAVRFIATLDFWLEETTRAALSSAPDVFARVAWERKRDELEKLLAGRALLRALGVLYSSSLLGHLAPELLRIAPASLLALERVPAQLPWLRFAAWCIENGVGVDGADAVLQRWRTPKATRQRVRGVLGAASALSPRGPPQGAELRRWLAYHDPRFGLETARLAAALWPDAYASFPSQVRRVLRGKAPLRLADLAINGRELQAIGLRGPEVGRVQRALLEQVLDTPQKNRRRVLLHIANNLSTSTAEA